MSSHLEKRLQELSEHYHCCNCGNIDPEIGEYAGVGQAGFTLCCSEAVCKREHWYSFGDGVQSVDACCWAMADIKFQMKNIDVSKMQEIRRVQLD